MIENPEIKLKQLRELKNFTQEYMAQQLGLTTRAYSKIESGETQLTINRLNEIAKILEVDPVRALGFDHQNVFNNYGTQEGNIAVSQTLVPDKLIEQYESRIRHLEDEIVFLRALVKKVCLDSIRIAYLDLVQLAHQELLDTATYINPDDIVHYSCSIQNLKI